MAEMLSQIVGSLKPRKQQQQQKPYEIIHKRKIAKNAMGMVMQVSLDKRALRSTVKVCYKGAELNLIRKC